MDVDGALKELGVGRDDARVIGLLPLVYVAWADGKVQRAERATILAAARDLGWLDGGGAAVLERWLDERPSDAQVRTGLSLLDHLARSHGGAADAWDGDDLHHLLLLCEDVARAAGGLLGLGDGRSDAELRALEEIAAALDVDSAKSWRAMMRAG